jgi:hypothetical protein
MAGYREGFGLWLPRVLCPHLAMHRHKVNLSVKGEDGSAAEEYGQSFDHRTPEDSTWSFRRRERTGDYRERVAVGAEKKCFGYSPLTIV